ncbi:hypothetical protein IPF37_00700 [bacterium]|nr:MAG: hypothetical protein IPF37_00700 [bacterium]
MNNLRKVLLGAALAASVFNFGIYAAANEVDGKEEVVEIQQQDLQGKFVAFKKALIAGGITEFPTTFENWVTSEELSAIDTDMLNKFVEDLDVNALIQEMVRKKAMHIEPIENGSLRVVFNTGRVIIVASWIVLEAIIANGLYTAGMAPMLSTLSQYFTIGSVLSLGSAAVQVALPKSGEKRKRS